MLSLLSIIHCYQESRPKTKYNQLKILSKLRIALDFVYFSVEGTAIVRNSFPLRQNKRALLDISPQHIFVNNISQDTRMPQHTEL